MTDTSRAINRVFTRGVIGDLMQQGSNEVFDCVVRRYIDDPESKTHGQLFCEIYAHLGKEKRNEYYYMNTLLNKLLVGIHNVNTTTALSKIRIGQSIADFIMINGEGKIYALEVKSELDNFDRLYDQISNYYKAFSKVSVLASVRELDKIEQILSGFGDMGDAVGIYVLSDRDTIFSKTHGREPQQFNECLDYACIFKMLRKREYENVLLSYFGDIPQVAPVYHFRVCLEQFQTIPILTAQDLSLKELKKRNRITKEAFDNIPSELKTVVYFSELARKLPALENMLQKNYRG
ncbi:sce7726 family protein [Oscillospiraceae bacterium OttesenSCG-928-G22]|nr:sce7726 family protein [Oscillospiraceae bacterium OttesenSCG-928-G22]